MITSLPLISSPAGGLPTAGLLRSYIAGLILSTVGNSTAFSISPGVAVDSTNSSVIVLANGLSKTNTNWSAGNGNGALDVGTISVGTQYNVFVIENETVAPGAVDILVSQALTPQLPTNYTLSRRIGSIFTDGLGNWIKFHQNGDEFLWDVPTPDAVNTPTINGSVFLSLTVPIGFQVNAIGTIRLNYNTVASAMYLSSPDITPITLAGQGLTVAGASATSTISASDFNVRTNTAGQIRVTANGAGCNYYISTAGWIDRRGKDN
jgi:hypothetical protein